jgi:hypothetical protein
MAAGNIAIKVFTGPYMEELRELTDTIGPRVTGSAAYNRAADWAAAKFREAGLSNVHFETFTIQNGWQRGPALAQLLAPVARTLRVEPVGWTPPTPGELTSSVLVLSNHTASAIKERNDIRGRIVLLELSRANGGDGGESPTNALQILPLLKEKGAAAVLFPDSLPNNVLGDSTDLGFGLAQVLPLPCVEIGMEDAAYISRLAKHGDVRMGVRVDTQVTGPLEVHNVLAEIPGREKTDEWVLLGAHLDSWDLGSGAQDNGTGTITVLEVARVLQQLDVKPRRTIRFALWGGEEQGLIGSTSYVKAHRGSDLSRCVTVVNTDDGSGHPWGWKLHGRLDVQDAMRPIANELLSEYDAEKLSVDASYDTDHGPFLLEGIPVLDLLPEEVRYNEIHHKASDTFDKVDPVYAKSDAAVVGMTTYAVADLPRPIAPRLNHHDVEIMLKRTGLYGSLTEIGAWKP